MPRPLTTKQLAILEIIHRFGEERGYPPTLAELAEDLGLTPSTIQGHVDRLIKKGALTRDGEGRRTLRITDEAFVRSKHPGLPMCGRIQAGSPLEPVENAELVEVKELLRGARPGCYLLEVSGDSMQDAGILNGDYVMIDPGRPPRAGDTVVAITPDDEATLKEYYREGNKVRLQPRNANYQPIIVDRVEIRGVMVGLIRSIT